MEDLVLLLSERVPPRWWGEEASETTYFIISNLTGESSEGKES